MTKTSDTVSFDAKDLEQDREIAALRRDFDKYRAEMAVENAKRGNLDGSAIRIIIALVSLIVGLGGGALGFYFDAKTAAFISGDELDDSVSGFVSREELDRDYVQSQQARDLFTSAADFASLKSENKSLADSSDLLKLEQEVNSIKDKEDDFRERTQNTLAELLQADAATLSAEDVEARLGTVNLSIETLRVSQAAGDKAVADQFTRIIGGRITPQIQINARAIEQLRSDFLDEIKRQRDLSPEAR